MKHFYKFLLFAGFCLSISGCGGDGDDPTALAMAALSKIDLYGKDLPATLASYNDLKMGLDHQQKAGNPAMYVDFSAGMNTAFGTPVIKDLMSQCFNTVLAQQFEVYRLAEEQVTPITVSNSTQLGQIVSDSKQYLDVRAPIQAAVEKIVSSKNDALLITDFEEWQNDAEVTSTAYLKIPFSKWLKAGNSISFFIADYQEGKVAKHVYFTVFTFGRASGNSLIDKLRSRLSSLPAKFNLATDAYLISTDYPGAKSGGIFRDPAGKDEKSRNVLDLQPTYISGVAIQKPFEYYPLGISWATIADLRKDYQPQGQFDDLLRGLKLDLRDHDSYHDMDFEIKAYDITADFERFAKSIEVKKHKPQIIKGKNGEDEISSKEQDAIALGCYDSHGSVKADFSYEPVNMPVLNDLFVLNKALFNNTQKTDESKVEIGVSFGGQFGLDKIPNPSGLMKIVLSIRQASVSKDNPTLDKFKWINRNGVPNVGLYASIQATLDELKPADEPIYTYYIKTTE